MNLAPLIETVQHNCHIADARHARDLTMCNYLLEMREFYRWECDMPFGMSPPREEISRWLTEREALWEQVAGDDFAAVPVSQQRFEPFDVAAINRALAPLGLVYGAGIGRFGRPHFFLGRLDRRESVDGLQVVVIACEYARDLAAIPAALQGDTIIVRVEALRQFLWEKAEAWGVKQAAGPMRRALECYGWFDDAAAALERMTTAEIASVILHERGVLAAGRELGPEWEHMLSGFRERRAEILARAVRDHLADCLVTLPALVERQSWAALHVWFANLEGMRRSLVPSLLAAGEAWVASGDVAPIVAEARRGVGHWRTLARQLLDIRRTDDAGAEARIAAMTANLDVLAL